MRKIASHVYGAVTKNSIESKYNFSKDCSISERKVINMGKKSAPIRFARRSANNANREWILALFHPNSSFLCRDRKRKKCHRVQYLLFPSFLPSLSPGLTRLPARVEEREIRSLEIRRISYGEACGKRRREGRKGSLVPSYWIRSKVGGEREGKRNNHISYIAEGALLRIGPGYGMAFNKRVQICRVI